MNDLADLKARLDLQDLVVPLLGEGQRRGKALLYRAPWRSTDHTPSFAVYTDGFHDFGTGESGTALDFLMRHFGLTLPEAITQAQRYLGENPQHINRPRHERPSKTPQQPSPAWQAEASAQLRSAQAYLWSSAGEQVRRYLHEQRGLSDETIRQAGLGYNPGWRKTGYLKEDDQSAYLPPGILIPYIKEGQLYALRVRTPIGDLAVALGKPEAKGRTGKRLAKYLNFYGSQPHFAPFNHTAIQTNQPLVIVEGEFDALLAQQELGGEIGVITLGSASAALSPDNRDHINTCSVVYGLLDNDASGQKAAQRLQAELTTRVIPLSLPVGKDITDFVMTHRGDLKAWFSNCQTSPPRGWWFGWIPNSWRDAIMKYLPPSTIAVLEHLNEAFNRQWLDPDNITVDHIMKVSQIRGWGLKAATVRRVLAGNSDFFAILDTDSLLTVGPFLTGGPVSAVVSNSAKKSRGRPQKVYRALSLETAKAGLLARAWPAIYQQHHPVTGDQPILARPLPAMLAAVNADPTLAEGLGACFQPAYPISEDERQSPEAQARREYRQLVESLDDPTATPLPEGWHFTKDTEYKAAYCHAYVAAANVSQMPRREISRKFSVSRAGVSDLLKRAGIRNEPQFAQHNVAAEKPLGPQIKQGARKYKGYARTLGAVDAEGRPVYQSLHRDPLAAEQFVAACAVQGGQVYIEYQIASRQWIEHVTPQRIVRRHSDRAKTAQAVTSSERALTRHYGPGFDPRWVMAQFALAIQLLTDYEVRGEQLVECATGEVVCHQITGPILVDVLLGESLPLHPDPLIEEMLRLGGVIADDTHDLESGSSS